jgi:hypothetical protein
MKTGGVEVQLPAFLTSPLDKCEWSLCPMSTLPLGWVGSKAGVDMVAKRKNPFPMGK